MLWNTVTDQLNMTFTAPGTTVTTVLSTGRYLIDWMIQSTNANTGWELQFNGATQTAVQFNTLGLTSTVPTFFSKGYATFTLTAGTTIRIINGAGSQSIAGPGSTLNIVKEG
jgi:hypothetical protein